jgi:mRNA interferase YafQ
MLRFVSTTQFNRDMKTIAKRGLDIDLLQEVVGRLCRREQLEKQFQDHALKGKYKGNRECHIQADWLFVYRVEGDQLIGARTGSHSDLF